MNKTERLIQCSACENDIAREAPNCPKCGNPNAAHVDKKNKEGAVALILGLGVAWLGLSGGYFIFPMDTIVFAGVMIVYAIIRFAR